MTNIRPHPRTRDARIFRYRRQRTRYNPNHEPGINDDIVAHQGTTCISNPNGGGQSCTYTSEDISFMRALTCTPGSSSCSLAMAMGMIGVGTGATAPPSHPINPQP
ncbi:hypothetical protein GQ43DRAFT_444869 [Delitschia confertaspora ATCC 74209]|uniref:Uncharacterized protein n=1 Tax=Delitschia confertaspora ATCC 74209 TaxID=1513339 RepID=A0A9P4JGB9_9PLEO|nr:hypothetical protein GQ43DRAFT_444869 [Delitschia confertaspora ATCC 74209]